MKHPSTGFGISLWITGILAGLYLLGAVWVHLAYQPKDTPELVRRIVVRVYYPLFDSLRELRSSVFQAWRKSAFEEGGSATPKP